MMSAPSAFWISIERSGVRSMPRAVDLVAEAHAAVADLGAGQREHLEAAAVGQDRAVPAHEAVQAAELLDEALARPQRQVVGVGEHHLGAGGAHLVGRQGLDGAVGAHRHEGRRLDQSVRRREAARAGGSGAGLEAVAERRLRHGRAGSSGTSCARRSCGAGARAGASPSAWPGGASSSIDCDGEAASPSSRGTPGTSGSAG